MESLVIADTIWLLSSKCLPYITWSWPTILQAIEPSLALASLIYFLLTSMDSTLPILKLSLSGIIKGVPILRIPDFTFTPITIGDLALKQAFGTISSEHGKIAFTPSSCFLSLTHLS
jgi:hypothetical protein